MEKASPVDHIPYSVRKEKLRQAKQAEEAKLALRASKGVNVEEEKAYVVEVQIPVTPEPILLQSKSPLEEPAVMSSQPAEPEPVVDNGPVEAEMVSSVVIETEELPEPEPVVMEEPEPVAVKEAPVTGPEEAVVEEAPAAPAEPVVVEEAAAPAAPAEPAVEEAPAEPVVVKEEAPAEPVVVEEAATVTTELIIEDVKEPVQDEVIEPKVEEEVLATPIIEDEKVEAPPVVEEKEPTPPPVVEAPSAPVEENVELITEEKRQKGIYLTLVIILLFLSIAYIF